MRRFQCLAQMTREFPQMIPMLFRVGTIRLPPGSESPISMAAGMACAWESIKQAVEDMPPEMETAIIHVVLDSMSTCGFYMEDDMVESVPDILTAKGRKWPGHRNPPRVFKNALEYAGAGKYEVEKITEGLGRFQRSMSIAEYLKVAWSILVSAQDAWENREDDAQDEALSLVLNILNAHVLPEGSFVLDTPVPGHVCPSVCDSGEAPAVLEELVAPPLYSLGTWAWTYPGQEDRIEQIRLLWFRDVQGKDVSFRDECIRRPRYAEQVLRRKERKGFAISMLDSSEWSESERDAFARLYEPEDEQASEAERGLNQKGTE